jgi:hypothetical protein
VAVLRRTVLAVLGLALLTTGCARQADDAEVPTPQSGSTSTPAGSGPPTTAAASPIPQFCDEVIPFTEVVRIVAVPISGGSSRTYATDFSTESGRTARLTCHYGVEPSPARGAAPPPRVEITLSSYVDAAAAAARLEDTVGSARSSGQQVEAQAGVDHQGFLLADASDITYVAAVCDRTVVVTLARKMVPAAAERVVLLGLAEAALGVPLATANPTASPSAS